MTGFSYMGDLLMDFSAPRQVNDNLYRMALAAFEAVAQTPSDLDWVLRYFEVWLLKLEGFFAGPSRVRRCRNAFNGEDRFISGRISLFVA